MVLRSLSSDSPKVNQACRKGIGLLTKPAEDLRKKRKANNFQRFHFIIPTKSGETEESLLSLSSGISIKMYTSGFITITIRYLSGALDIELNRKIESLFVQDLSFSNITYFFIQYPLCQSSLDFVCSLLSSLLLLPSSSTSSRFVRIRTANFAVQWTFLHILLESNLHYLRYFTLLESLHYFRLLYFTLYYPTELYNSLPSPTLVHRTVEVSAV